MDERDFKTVVLDITEDDILYGRPGDCHDCPAARVLFRMFPDAASVYVGPILVRIDFLADCVTFAVPMKLRSFITRFDAAGKDAVRPGRYEVHVPNRRVPK